MNRRRDSASRDASASMRILRKIAVESRLTVIFTAIVASAADQTAEQNPADTAEPCANKGSAEPFAIPQAVP